MSKQAKLIGRMRASPQSVTCTELFNFCCDIFGEPRQRGTSHAVFEMPWAGDPRVNIEERQRWQGQALSGRPGRHRLRQAHEGG